MPTNPMGSASVAKYMMANPDTQLVETVQAPDENAIANWPQNRFMIAVFPNDSKKEAKHPDYRIVYGSAKTNGSAESSKKPNKHS